MTEYVQTLILKWALVVQCACVFILYFEAFTPNKIIIQTIGLIIENTKTHGITIDTLKIN